MSRLSSEDRSLLLATQAGLPVCAEPFSVIAAEIGTTEQDVLVRFGSLIRSGVVRRIAAAPNHFRLGMTANGMSVWNIDDAAVDELGQTVGALDFVTHCYRRPRSLPLWPYNLFAMIHGTSRAEVEAKRSEIARLVAGACRESDILYSTRILKKTGVRLSKSGD